MSTRRTFRTIQPRQQLPIVIAALIGVMTLNAGCLPPSRNVASRPAPTKATNFTNSNTTASSSRPAEIASANESLSAGDNSIASEETIQEDNADTDRNASDQSDVAAAPPPLQVNPKRILCATSDGVLLLDIVLTIDGLPHDKLLDDLVDDVVTLADVDGDGRATWVELVDHPRFKYGQFGNIATPGEAERTQVARMYDIDKNGIVDRREVPRYLTRNANAGRSFGLLNDKSGVDRRYESPLLKWLDQDGNGHLSNSEIEAAPVRLRSLDADANDLLVAAELTGEGESNTARRSRYRVPETAVVLDEKTDWQQTQYLLEEHYSIAGELTEASYPDSEFFRQLDQDTDGQLSSDEVSVLRELPAHARLLVRFGIDTETDKGSRLEFELEEASPLTIAAASDRRISFRLPHSLFTVFLNDRVAEYGSQAITVFSSGDSDKNQYLDEEEFGNLGQFPNVEFEALDQDQNGMIYQDELESYYRQQQSVVRGQIRSRASQIVTPLMSALDQNHDGRLSTREIESSPAQLRTMDGNDDDRLDFDELPIHFTLGFVRGPSEQLRELFVLPAEPDNSNDAPRWFNSMDLNKDGDLSRGEFLGDAAQFDELDQNSDGFLDSSEALSAGSGAELGSPPPL